MVIYHVLCAYIFDGVDRGALFCPCCGMSTTPCIRTHNRCTSLTRSSAPCPPRRQLGSASSDDVLLAGELKLLGMSEALGACMCMALGWRGRVAVEMRSCEDLLPGLPPPPPSIIDPDFGETGLKNDRGLYSFFLSSPLCKLPTYQIHEDVVVTVKHYPERC